MKIKHAIFLLLLIFSRIGIANMASPIREGTKGSTVFSSKDIDIIKEKLIINVNSDFSKADFKAEYFISSDKEGKQIPLLFFAMNYEGEFNVWVDDVKTELLNIPDEYLLNSDKGFNEFSDYFESTTNSNERKVVNIQFEENSGREYYLSDLKYFEVALSKGVHSIRVEYTATVWKDKSGWVNKYSFPYSLSPAKHWKSFGEFEVNLNSIKSGKILSANLGHPDSGNLSSSAIWNFKKLPDIEILEINYIPEINSFTKALIKIEPFGLAFIAGLFLTAFHFLLIRTYRISNPDKKFSWVMISGSFLIPFFMILSFVLSFELIDFMIGSDAGNYHGYTFLSFALYPVILIIYLIIMITADTIIKKRQLKKN